MAVIGDSLWLLLDPGVMLAMVLAAAFGLFVGAVPGLTATMAVALLVPVTFFMEPLTAIAAIVSASAMAIFAGDLPSILLRIPGTPASAAYADAGYRMMRAGKAELALGTALMSSALGGLFGAMILILFAPLIARFALGISSYEYFWLACLGLTSAAFISPGRPVKGVISLLLGLVIATVGLFPVTGQPRFTFGLTPLLGGISLVPVLIGIFAVAEVLRFATRRPEVVDAPRVEVGNVFRGLGRALWPFKSGILRGMSIGTAIGALPGAGADIASWISYALARKLSRQPEKFDDGSPEGIASASAANNASVSSSYIPATVLGIPGDSLTAIVIGVLFMKGLTPGPTIFTNQPTLIYAIFLSFFLANLLLIPMGYVAIRLARRILSAPRQILMPVILMFCIVGAFAMDNTIFSVVVMGFFGLVGWFMEENDFPVAPALLGLVLGRLLEETFLTSMLKAQGDFTQFFTRPLSGLLGVLTILIWLSPLLIALWRYYRTHYRAPQRGT